MKSQREQNIHYRQHRANRNIYFALAAGIICLVVLCVVGEWLLFPSTKPSIQSDNVASRTFMGLLGSTSEKDNTTAPTGKLADASESVDENGIVHGITPDGIAYTIHGRGEKSLVSGKITLAAVGDQIGTDNSLPIAEQYGGGLGSGVYNFSPFYREVAPFIQSYDLRFINQETVMAGNGDGLVYSGYPTFNTPAAAAQAIAENGFNLVNFATNHIYDLGTFGVERSHEVWAAYPKLMIGGSYLTQEDRETVHMIERNGLTFAFLAYTYGDNMYGTDMPNTYYDCPFDKEAIEADVKRAKRVADAVIVSMHWGTEYTSEPNDQQLDYARFLADLDVDLVLGTHAHIMQPVKYITGESGNTIPVVFGLGDFISGWTLTDTILSGLFTCDFVRNDQGGVDVCNLAWYPLIEWSDGGDVYVRFLKDMDETTINANTRTSDVSNDFDYLREKIDSVGMEIPVIM